MENKKKEKTIKIDIGVVDRPWYYSSNPRLEGLFTLLPYIKWINISEEENRKYNILAQIERKKEIIEYETNSNIKRRSIKNNCRRRR